MTQVIDLTKSEPQKEKNKIQFLKAILDLEGNPLSDPKHIPEDWDVIELICRGNYMGKDLMFAYDKGERSNGYLYLGHFNDGVV
jgi:hypothetical protein